MAKGKYSNYYGKRKKRGSKHGELEKIAFKLGCVQRGLKNPDSLISESYNNGFQEREPKQKKSLF